MRSSPAVVFMLVATVVYPALAAVMESDPSVVTQLMPLISGSCTVTDGFNSNGGEYGNFQTISGCGHSELEGVNLVPPGYGQGWQGAIFDGAHLVSGCTGYILNPTQAGSSLNYGTPVTVSVSTGHISVPLYQVALFNALPCDPYTNLDSDTNFTADYQDVSGTFGIPALQIRYTFAYMRQPNAIRQFAQYFIPGNAVVDISPQLSGNQTGTSDDFNFFQQESGIRVDARFGTKMWTVGGLWKTASGLTQIACKSIPDNLTFSLVGGGTTIKPISQCGGGYPDYNLMLMCTDSNPDTNLCEGLWAPQSGNGSWFNASQTHILYGGGAHADEDRRIQVWFQNDSYQRYGNTWIEFRAMRSISGLRNPTAVGGNGYETVSEQTFELVGSANAIRAAVTSY